MCRCWLPRCAHLPRTSGDGQQTHPSRPGRALAEAGVDEAGLARLASPVGLDLGARTPQETAVSIAAEIIQHHWGGTGRPLGELTGTIHHQP
ncbi:XdhC family protein [Streptomyces sp. M10(2022)]